MLVPPTVIRRLPRPVERIEGMSLMRSVRRIVLTTAGVLILAVGVALLVLPGPGFLVIVLGLLILSLEYEWARRRLVGARARASSLSAQAAANVLSTVFTAGFGVGAVVVGVLWALAPSLPGSSWWTGGSLVASGLIVLATLTTSHVQARRQGRPLEDRVPRTWPQR
jgi:hypothetical protein